MEYLGEAIALGIDSIILGICLRQYFVCSKAINAVKNVEIHDVNSSLVEILKTKENGKIGYVAIRGYVKALGKPLYGVNDKRISGVVQKLTVKEHVVARTTAGFWSDQERTMQQILNTVPFSLKNGDYGVEVVDPLEAQIFDMDVISDEFKPSAPTIADHIWGFFTGVRQRGLQSTEEMLREDIPMTGIGELSLNPAKIDQIILQPPSKAPFYLTTMSVSSLLRKLDDKKTTYRLLCIVFGTIGIIIGGIIVKRYLKDRDNERIADELRKNLEQSRKERRQRVRDGYLRDDQLCIVCRTNPREIILLPCGHVCLCEDCSDCIQIYCPVCRQIIEQKAAAYIT